MAQQPGLKDILEPRRLGSDVQWATRRWDPVVACIQPRKSSAESIKTTVLHSSRLKHVINEVSEEEKTSSDEVYKRVAAILQEMGYNREMPVLRWLGLFTSKILKRLCSAIYVNEDVLLKVKAEMGRNPVLFVPTHRSYGDFILMSYVCFHYELDVPRIAAGMDFHGMTLMGEILRDSCAFFMRRTFSQDKLYSATFSEYVQTLVTHGDAAVEFFIEGTRSRSAKSLMPKFGFLTTALRPYLTGLVPDISIVPVNVSYDRCLEESLFAYELLGVPKPKESTMRFIKALKILKEDYGKVFIQFGEPLSVSEALRGRIDRSVHSYGPVILQDLTPTESQHVVGLAHDIINRQRNLTVLTCFNLVAAVLNSHLVSNSGIYLLTDLVQEVRWLADVLQKLGAVIDLNLSSVDTAVKESIRLHRLLVGVNGNEVRLLHGQPHAPIPSGSSLRGCELIPQTMDLAVPFVMLQHYVNPCCHYVTSICSHIYALLDSSKHTLNKNDLLHHFSWFRNVFAHEFIFYDKFLEKDFEISLGNAANIGVISIDGDWVRLSQDTKSIKFFVNFMAPFVPAYLSLSEALLENPSRFIVESMIIKSAQDKIQQKLHQGNLSHAANLSLDVLSNGLQSFCAMGVLKKTRTNGNVLFEAQADGLKELSSNLRRMNSRLLTLKDQNRLLRSVPAKL